MGVEGRAASTRGSGKSILRNNAVKALKWEVGFISQQVLGVQKCIKAGRRLDLVSPAWSHPSPEGVSAVA